MQGMFTRQSYKKKGIPHKFTKKQQSRNEELLTVSSQTNVGAIPFSSAE